MTDATLPPQRKIWDINDMPVERDGIRIFAHVYDFAGPADISAQDMAEIMRLEARIRQQQTEPAGQLTDEQQRQQVEEMFKLAKFRTRLILVSEIADDVLDKLSLRQHEFICTSFWQASNAAGKQPQEATSGAATSAPAPIAATTPTPSASTK